MSYDADFGMQVRIWLEPFPDMETQMVKKKKYIYLFIYSWSGNTQE